MGKIFYVMGKVRPARTIYKKLLERFGARKRLSLYRMTNSIRDGETAKVWSTILPASQLEQMKTEGRVIESRTYETVFGPWYCTVNDSQIDLDRRDYLMIGTLESVQKTRD